MSSAAPKTTQRTPFKRWCDENTGLFFLIPWILGFLIFKAYPFASSLFYSFTDLNFFKGISQYGIMNYVEIFTSRKTISVLLTTVKYAFITVPLKLVFAMINYLHETQKHGVERIKTVQNYADAQYMRLSPVTRANLELTETMRGREKRGTLLWVLDKTETSMGKRLLRSWIEQPLVDAEAINRRLSAVQALYTANMARADLKEALSHVFDIERLTTRILYGSATPREVKALGDTCAMLPEVRSQAAACGAPLLKDLADQIDPLEDILNKITTALVDDPPATLKDGGAIRAGYNSEVDELRDIMHGGKGYLSNLEAKYREETGIPKLKIGFNKVFGYYIEVSRSYTDSVPDTCTRPGRHPDTDSWAPHEGHRTAAAAPPPWER